MTINDHIGVTVRRVRIRVGEADASSMNGRWMLIRDAVDDAGTCRFVEANVLGAAPTPERTEVMSIASTGPNRVLAMGALRGDATPRLIDAGDDWITVMTPLCWLAVGLWETAPARLELSSPTIGDQILDVSQPDPPREFADG